MTLTVDTVYELSNRAKITIHAAEASTYVTSLARIIELAKEVNQVDTSAVEPITHSFGTFNPIQRLRPDAVTESDQCEQLQRLAPTDQISAHLYLVPLVIEE